MSTIKVNNIQDAGTVDQIQQGRAKMWINFDATNSNAIRDKFNVSSITDHFTGYHQISFASAMPSGNYSVLCQGSTGNDLSFAAADEDFNAAGSCRVILRTDRTSNATDFPYVGVVIHGD
tara:strand:+ start:296 stop:655 length:360 start_codon:yes stop_codon:yes gene_type:complete